MNPGRSENLPQIQLKDLQDPSYSHQLDDEVPLQKNAEWPKLGMDVVEPECEYIKIEEHPVLPHFLDPGQPKVDVSCEGTIESQSGN